MPSTCYIQYVSESARPSSGHRTGKGQSSSQFLSRVVPRNVHQTIELILLVRSCLKSCMLGFSIIQTKNFQISKLGLEKEEEPEIKLPTFCWIIEKAREFQKKKKSTSVSLTMPNSLIVWINITLESS